jgi:hypothetical protein
MAITECDPLHDDNVAHGRADARCRRRRDRQVYPGTIHSFLEAVSVADVAGRAFDDTARWMRERSARLSTHSTEAQTRHVRTTKPYIEKDIAALHAGIRAWSFATLVTRGPERASSRRCCPSCSTQRSGRPVRHCSSRTCREERAVRRPAAWPPRRW